MVFLYKNKTIIYFTFIFVLFHFSIAANKLQYPGFSETGIPFLTNISPKEYGANGQNWAAVQDSNGLLYFANGGGAVLQYDGATWNSIPVGNGSIVRDIQIDTDGKIFIGLQDDFGYLDHDESDKLVYKSLIDRVVCNHGEFGDIWKIGITSDHIYFLERHHLLRLSKKDLADSTLSILALHTETRFHNLFEGQDNQFFVHQVDVGLMQTNADSLLLIVNGDFFKRDLLAGVLPMADNNWLVISRKRGLFVYSENGQIDRFQTNFDDLLINSQPYHAIRLRDDNFAIASKYGGLFIISSEGVLVQHIDEDVGLANNTVWSVYEDTQQGLWLSLNKGITHIDYKSPFTTIDERNGLKGSIHDIIRHNGKIFITSNYGLFVAEANVSKPGRLHFSQVRGINTSGWDLLSAWNTLFIVANSGIFILNGNQAQLVFKYDPWEFYQSNFDPRRIYIGLASGVASFYIQEDGSLKNEGKIPGIDIEARTVMEDDEANLWVASSYQGVLKAASINDYFESGAKPVVNIYDETNGLPKNMLAFLAEGAKDLLFSTPMGIYKFDQKKSSFSLNPDFTGLNKKKQVDETYMVAQKDGSGDVWSHVGQRIVLNKHTNDGKYSLIDTAFWGIPEEEIQCIYPDGEQFVWFGHRNGVIIYDKNNQRSTDSEFNVLIRETVLNSKVILPSNQSDSYKNQVPEIQYSSDNLLRFKFAAQFYKHPEKTLYQYRLENFDRTWSAWTNEIQKDYTNLPYGNYTLLVQAKNVFGIVEAAQPYSFIILAPWYQNTWAYTIFFLLLIGMLVFLSRSLIAYSRSNALLEHQRLEEQRRSTEESIRSQVAADFHDELGTRITRISLFSEILRGELPDASATAQGYLGKISKNADRLYDETRDFIWQLDPQKDTLADFITRMKTFGDELFENTDIQFDLDQQVENPIQIKLDMDQRRNLIRIIKEAMHNALKYAKCKNVILKISATQESIYLILSDNGIGFTVDNGNDGIGLKNMQQRAEKIKANLNIDSQQGKGTQIRLSIKYD